jgi:hypothetical protein
MLGYDVALINQSDTEGQGKRLPVCIALFATRLREGQGPT